MEVCLEVIANKPGIMSAYPGVQRRPFVDSWRLILSPAQQYVLLGSQHQNLPQQYCTCSQFHLTRAQLHMPLPSSTILVISFTILVPSSTVHNHTIGPRINACSEPLLCGLFLTCRGEKYLEIQAI